MSAPEMKSWTMILPLATVAFVSMIALGGWRESERLSTIAAERLQVAESYARSEELARTRARHHSGMVDLALRSIDGLDELPDAGWLATERAQAEKNERDAAKWGALKEKYRKAASTPWSAVEPDVLPPVE